MNILKKIVHCICILLFPRLRGATLGVPLLVILKCGIVQKIFRINSHVPWPVHWSSKIIQPDNIERGTRFPGLALSCHIDGRNGIKFGENVWIGPRVSIVSMNHDVNDYFSFIKNSPIELGDNCWLGTNAIILPGVVIGEHTIVAAGAVVTKSFAEGNQVIGGNPAKVLKKLRPYAGIRK